jgi:hypothetical protein
MQVYHLQQNEWQVGSKFCPENMATDNMATRSSLIKLLQVHQRNIWQENQTTTKIELLYL